MAITYTPNLNLAKQDFGDPNWHTELNNNFDKIDSAIANLTAADIANTPAGNISATDVQAAINELDSEKVSKSGSGELSANQISFSPYGNLSATDVQAAIQELDDEKLAKTGGILTGDITISKQDAILTFEDPITGKKFRFLFNDTDNNFIIQHYNGTSWSDIARTDGSIKFRMEKNYLCYVYLGADISFPSQSWTPVTYDSIIEDVNTWWDTTNKRFQPDVAGYYHIHASAGAYTTLVEGSSFELRIKKNGAGVNKGQLRFSNSSSATRLEASATVYLDGISDYIDVDAYQSTGNDTVKIYGSQFYTNFIAFKIG